MSKPSHIVKVKHRDKKYGTRVGAAWPTKSGGGLNINLDPGITIMSGEGIYITLWPNEEGQGGGNGGEYGGGGGRQYGQGYGAQQGGRGDGQRAADDAFGTEDIPF